MTCLCGCGGETPIAKRTRNDIGHVAGRPVWYRRGHGPSTSFWGRVRFPENLDDCWEWTGNKRSGYGLVSLFGRRHLGAHRLAYEACVGPIPAGLLIRHDCDNPSCVNPDHLRPGTDADNSRDARERGRLRTGGNHPNAKLTDEQTAAIVERSSSGELAEDLAVEYGVTLSTIWRWIRVARGGKP